MSRTRPSSSALAGWILPVLLLALAVALFRDWLGVQGLVEALLRLLVDVAMAVGRLAGEALQWFFGLLGLGS